MFFDCVLNNIINLNLLFNIIVMTFLSTTGLDHLPEKTQQQFQL